MQPSSRVSDLRMDLWAVPAVFVAFLILAFVVAAQTSDPLMSIQAWTFMAGVGIAILWLVQRYSGGIPEDDRSAYANDVVKAGVIASMFWGIAGMLVGVIIALQLAFPSLFYFPDLPFTNFGRLRPLHTSAVIFAFGGNVLIATSFYVVQRTCKARLAGGLWPWFVFWGYQTFILVAGTGYLLGVSQGREYAEPEWYTDLWLTLVWVAYLLVFLGTL